jgi:hypothetical protein
LIWVGVVEFEGALAAIFTTFVAGLAGLAPALTIVVVVVDEAGDVFVVVLPDEITLIVFTELVGALLLAIEVEPPPDPKEPPPEPNEPPPELDANVITGAATEVGDAVETKELEKLGADATGITTGVIVVAVVCGPMAEQGGPPGQPVITS